MKNYIDYVPHMLVIAILLFSIANATLLTSGYDVQNNTQQENVANAIKFDESVGKKAPDFELESIDGEKVNLSNLKGKNVVLFFNEGSMCYPSCWSQITAFGNDERFNANDIVVFSIQVDQKSDWEKITSQVSKFSESKLLFDSTRAVSSAFDVLTLKSSMHPGRYPGHTYFIIDKEGVIRYTLDDPKMAIRNDEIFNELEKLRY